MEIFRLPPIIGAFQSLHAAGVWDDGDLIRRRDSLSEGLHFEMTNMAWKIKKKHDADNGLSLEETRIVYKTLMKFGGGMPDYYTVSTLARLEESYLTQLIVWR